MEYQNVTKMLFWNVLISSLFICLFAKRGDGLKCYGCDYSSSLGACEKNSSLLVYHKIKGGHYSRPCEIPNQRFCMIESIKKNYETVSFIRDCSDGITFSMEGIGRLERVPANNQSTCAFSQGYTVCISLCQRDFCNGPQETDPGQLFLSDVARVKPEYFLLFLVFVISCTNIRA